MRVLIFILFISLTSAISKAQQKTTHTNMIWVEYYNTLHLDKKWALVSDVQLHKKDWINLWSQALLEAGASYIIDNHFIATACFAFVKNAQYQNKILLFANEFRPWQEITYQSPLNKFYFIQRLRTEERFQQQVDNGNKTPDYNYIFRLRYLLACQVYLNKAIRFAIGNELYINPGHATDNLFFDQNRTFGAVNFRATSSTNFQFQYIKIFKKNITNPEDQNVFRFNIYQQFNLKRHGAK